MIYNLLPCGKTVVKNSIGTPTSSATNDTSSNCATNKHGTCNHNRRNFGVWFS